MRVLRVHNRYQHKGGEDAVFAAEAKLLETNGHQVERLEFTNDEIAEDRHPLDSARLAISTVWSQSARTRIRSALDRLQPDVVHFDNTFPLISPGAYGVVRRAGIPVIQTLHNYRLLCPSATLFRDGRVCEDCLNTTPPLPGVIHGCYRGSRGQSAVVAAMLTVHRARGTWSRDVDVYISLTEFARKKFAEGGLPADRIVVKPNFLDAPPITQKHRTDSFLFVGRLSPEKGIRTLLRAQPFHGRPLRVAGEGPLCNEVKSASAGNPDVKFLGRLDSGAVREEMVSARALIFSSEWYEGFPMTLLEAFASSLPVIGPRLGSVAEIVDDGKTGLLFSPGDAQDLASKVVWASSHPAEMERMGDNARRAYERLYTPERNYSLLMGIYDDAVRNRRRM